MPVKFRSNTKLQEDEEHSTQLYAQNDNPPSPDDVQLENVGFSIKINTDSKDSLVSSNPSNPESTKPNAVTRCDTQPMTERVKFDWKIKNFDVICPPGSKGFDPCRSTVFSVGAKVGKKSSWCFELRYSKGYLSMVLCRDKIRINMNGSSGSQQNVPCEISFISPSGPTVLHGQTVPFPSSYVGNDSVMSQIQVIASKIGASAVPREFSGWKHFISVEELHQNRDKYMSTDGTLHFKMVFDIVGVVNIPSADESAALRLQEMKHLAMERRRKQIVADLQALRDNQECSNIVIQCGTRVYSVHKQLIQARCPKFYVGLLDIMNVTKLRICKSTDPLLSKIIKIKDINPEIMQAFLEYVYTGTVKSLSKDYTKWQQLLQLADRSDAKKLKDICFFKMLGLLDLKNTGHFICLADSHGASAEVHGFVSAFYRLNAKLFKENEYFMKLRRENPTAFKFLNDDDEIL